MKHLFITFFLFLGLISRVWAEPITMVAWNVEDYDFSGRFSDSGSDGAVIAGQLRDDFNGIDIFGLSEVHNETAMQTYALMAGSDEEFSYKYIYGSTGGNLHLGMLVNSDRYEIVSSEELDFGLSANDTRFPLAVNLKDKTSGLEFTAVVVHLARGNAETRNLQAARLAEWSATNANSVIALGDFNFDYNIIDGSHNEGYTNLLKNGYFSWLKPDTLIDTSWSGPPDADSFPNSMLDFIFAGGEAKNWIYQSFVYEREGDFPDSGDTADHRPVFSYLNGGAQTALPEDYSYILPRLKLDTVSNNNLNAGTPEIRKYIFSEPLASATSSPLSQVQRGIASENLGAKTQPKAKVLPGGLEGIDPKLWPVIQSLRDLTKNNSTGYLAPGTDPNDFPPGILPYIRQGLNNGNIPTGYFVPGTDPSVFPPRILPYIRQLQTLQNIDGFDGK